MVLAKDGFIIQLGVMFGFDEIQTLVVLQDSNPM